MKQELHNKMLMGMAKQLAENSEHFSKRACVLVSSDNFIVATGVDCPPIKDWRINDMELILPAEINCLIKLASSLRKPEKAYLTHFPKWEMFLCLIAAGVREFFVLNEWEIDGEIEAIQKVSVRMNIHLNFLPLLSDSADTKID